MGRGGFVRGRVATARVPGEASAKSTSGAGPVTGPASSAPGPHSRGGSHRRAWRIREVNRARIDPREASRSSAAGPGPQCHGTDPRSASPRGGRTGRDAGPTGRRYHRAALRFHLGEQALDGVPIEPIQRRRPSSGQNRSPAAPTSRPNAEASPDAGGISTSRTPSRRATRAAVPGPAPPNPISVKRRGS